MTRWTIGAAALLLMAGCGRSGGASTSSVRSAEAVRQAEIEFQRNVEHGRYPDACASYTRRVLLAVGGQGRCVRQLAGVHDFAARERTNGVSDILSETIARAKAMRVTIRGHIATTRDLGRPGTLTRYLYVGGRWRIDRPET
jgi:hypothetical protein